MGCTSSAPNMVNSSTAEKSIQFEEETSDNQSRDTEEIIYRASNDTNEITVLPSCDTLAEPIHVVRNKSTPSLNTEKDSQEARHLNERIKKTVSSNTLKGEEIFPKLEEVVEKAVEARGSENMNDTQPVLKIAETLQNDDHKEKNNTKESNDVRHNEDYVGIEQDKQKEDHLEEAISPSQSESSRATRWEALADIAAELPPSLTVDPITGQIYALAK